MGRLLSIEFFKLRHTKYFWVLSGLFLLLLLFIPSAAYKIVAMINEGSQGIVGAEGIQIPFFDFVDLWQNLTFILKFFSIFLGFITVISMSNEYSYGMIKQNVIDGLSRTEFLLSKIYMIVTLSLIVSLVTLAIGLFMGYMHSPVTDLGSILEHIEFIPAYFLHLIAFQLFCLVVALLIKRSGITIAFLFFYVLMIEPILVLVMANHGMAGLAEFLPVNAINNIIRFPFYKYALQETLSTVSLIDLGILLGYIGLLTGLGYRLMTKRDLS
jgi:ABC-2 type transport system permease protein